MPDFLSRNHYRDDEGDKMPEETSDFIMCAIRQNITQWEDLEHEQELDPKIEVIKRFKEGYLNPEHPQVNKIKTRQDKFKLQEGLILIRTGRERRF